MRTSPLFPNIPSTEAIRKFSGHVLATCIRQEMNPQRFVELCHQYGMKFIYASANDLKLDTYGSKGDDKPLFWVYMVDLFKPSLPAQLNPIF